MIAVVSNSPPLPRAIEARYSFSRSARLVSCAAGGWPVVLRMVRHVLAIELALLGDIGRRVDLRIGQAVEFGARVDDDRGGVAAGDQLLVELRAQRGELAVDVLELDLVGFAQLGAGADEVV
jgi:hypothetical protein